MELQTSLLELMTFEPEVNATHPVTQVKVISSTFGGYLRALVISELLNDRGDIKPAIANSLHHVMNTKGLHFKQKPTHPLMEFAIHNLFFRVAGDLTPETTLVRFEVEIKGEIKIYPVLVSKTIEGSLLKEATTSHLQLDNPQWARWTWMLLCSLLTKPGDGRFSNYILDPHLNIFCVDNDIAFVEPVVKSVFSQKIHFCSALFCLFPERSLDRGVLKEFCALDVDAILDGWIEDVIEQEKAYVELFSEPEREKLYQEDPNNRFKATILFREGTLALLNLQFCHLQNYLRFILSQNKELFPLNLLEQNISI
jgi:NLR family CARD domain-containing protein 3